MEERGRMWTEVDQMMTRNFKYKDKEREDAYSQVRRPTHPQPPTTHHLLG